MLKVIGTGSYLPEKILTNYDLEKMVETSDEWITKRTGIKKRHIAANFEATSDMAIKSAQKALNMAGLSAKDIELLIVGTSTPDFQIPAVAPTIAHGLGCNNIPAFDLNSVCTSFAFSFFTAVSYLNSGFFKNCLVIGADTYSRILNWQDRTTCTLFGDGSGALILKRDLSAKGILSYNFKTDGSRAHLIKIPCIGSRNPVQKNNVKKEDIMFQMRGKDVYEFSIYEIPKLTSELIEMANLTASDVQWVVLHQANLRIINAVAKRLDLALDKFIITIDETGNTSSASIPIALDTACREGKIKEYDKVLILGFGGGLSWGGLLFEW